MGYELQRRLYGVLGVGLFLLVAVFVRARGFGHPENGPILEGQAVGLAVVGLLFVVAAVPSPVTDLVAWYRLTGLANVVLGVLVPLGFVDGGAIGASGTATTVVGVLGGLSLWLVGLDQLLFDGRHVYADPPGAGPRG